MIPEVYVLNKDNAALFSPFYNGSLSDVLDPYHIVLGGTVLGDTPCCLLIAEIKEDSLILDWIYVAERWRRMGIGESLLQSLLTGALWTQEIISIYVSVTDRDLISFFEQSGFYEDREHRFWEFRTELGALELPDQLLQKTENAHVVPLDAVPQQSWIALSNYLIKTPQIPCGIPLPIQPQDFLYQSRAYISGGEIYCLILLSVDDGGELIVSWAYASDKHPASLAPTLAEVTRILRKQFPLETPLIYGILGPNSMKLSKKLFPTGELRQVYICEYLFVEHLPAEPGGD